MDNLFVIKIGGNIIDDDSRLSSFLKDFSQIKDRRILIHGGGKLATDLAARLGIAQQMVAGRRLTDPETLKIVTMVYAGYINKNIVAQLQASGVNAIGLTGADGNLILAHKRVSLETDYGFAGDIDSINVPFLDHLLSDHVPVLPSITHDGKGQLLNTNADTIAQEVAAAMSPHYAVTLVYGFEKAGVLLDSNDGGTVIPVIDQAYYKQLVSAKVIFAGMIPKLDNAFSAIDRGVKKVVVGKAEELMSLITGTSGTSIINNQPS